MQQNIRKWVILSRLCSAQTEIEKKFNYSFNGNSYLPLIYLHHLVFRYWFSVFVYSFNENSYLPLIYLHHLVFRYWFSMFVYSFKGNSYLPLIYLHHLVFRDWFSMFVYSFKGNSYLPLKYLHQVGSPCLFITRIIQSLYYAPAGRYINAWMHSLIQTGNSKSL